jgi:purine-binding chemotaxis protein CheW
VHEKAGPKFVSQAKGIHEKMTTNEGESIKVLCFTIGGEEYGLDLREVYTVSLPAETVKVPMIPGFFEGLTRINESIVHLVDLRRQLGTAGSSSATHRRVIVARTDHGLVGVIADGTSGIFDINAGSIEPPSPVLSRTGLVGGIARIGDKLIPLLEVKHVLDSERPLEETAMIGHNSLQERSND